MALQAAESWARAHTDGDAATAALLVPVAGGADLLAIPVLKPRRARSAAA
jgi:hypothetical protein